MIELLLLGSGAMVPLPDRPLSSLLVRCNGRLVLFDCGEGTQTSWRRFHWGFRALDAICLSHLHADHVAGLPGLLHTVANAGKTDRLLIVGPAGTRAVVAGLRVIAPALPFAVEVRELASGDAFDLECGLRGLVREGEHRIPVLGYRMTMPRSRQFDSAAATALDVPVNAWSRLQAGTPIVLGVRRVAPDAVLGPERPGIAFGFVTDTRPSVVLRDLVAGVDLLVCESTYALDEERPKAIKHGHMTMREATNLAREGGVGALWLTHFGAGMRSPVEYAAAAAEWFPATTIGAAGLHGRLTFTHAYERIDVPADGKSQDMP